LVDELVRVGLVCVVDGDALAGYCAAWSEIVASTKTLQDEGRVIVGAKGGKIHHPAVSQQRSAMRALSAFAAQLGLNPAARARIRLTRLLKARRA